MMGPPSTYKHNKKEESIKGCKIHVITCLPSCLSEALNLADVGDDRFCFCGVGDLNASFSGDNGFSLSLCFLLRLKGSFRWRLVKENSLSLSEGECSC